MRDQSGASEEKNENERRGQMESVQMFVKDVECTLLLLMKIRAIFDMVSCTVHIHRCALYVDKDGEGWLLE